MAYRLVGELQASVMAVGTTFERRLACSNCGQPAPQRLALACSPGRDGS